MINDIIDAFSKINNREAVFYLDLKEVFHDDVLSGKSLNKISSVLKKCFPLDDYDYNELRGLLEEQSQATFFAFYLDTDVIKKHKKRGVWTLFPSNNKSIEMLREEIIFQFEAEGTITKSIECYNILEIDTHILNQIVPWEDVIQFLNKYAPHE